MRLVVRNARVVALCEAEVAVLVEILSQAVDDPDFDPGEAYVANELLRELLQ